ITWRPCLVRARRNILRRLSTAISTRLPTCSIRRSGRLSSAYAISWRPKSHRSSRIIGAGTSSPTISSRSCARSTSISQAWGTGATAPPAVAGCSTALSLWRWRDRYGDGAHRLLHRHLLGGSHWPVGGLDLSVRRRGAETALAATDDALGEDR